MNTPEDKQYKKPLNMYPDFKKLSGHIESNSEATDRTTPNSMETLERSSKTKTFQKGDDYEELIEWFMKQIETHDYQPEGTNWGGGEPEPHDPVCELKYKYIVTVTKV